MDDKQNKVLKYWSITLKKNGEILDFDKKCVSLKFNVPTQGLVTFLDFEEKYLKIMHIDDVYSFDSEVNELYINIKEDKNDKIR